MKKIIVVFLLNVSSVYANGPSFDCKKAQSKIEKTICNDPTLAKADLKLAQLYKKTLADFPRIKARQLKWLEERNDLVSKSGEELNKLLLDMYKTRIAYFEENFRKPRTTEIWNGAYGDHFDLDKFSLYTEVTIDNCKDNTCRFEYNQAGWHSCQKSATLTILSSTFAIADDGDSSEYGCQVDVIRSDEGIFLNSPTNGCHSECGAVASFDAGYYKNTELIAERKGDEALNKIQKQNYFPVIINDAEKNFQEKYKINKVKGPSIDARRRLMDYNAILEWLEYKKSYKPKRTWIMDNELSMQSFKDLVPVIEKDSSFRPRFFNETQEKFLSTFIYQQNLFNDIGDTRIDPAWGYSIKDNNLEMDCYHGGELKGRLFLEPNFAMLFIHLFNKEEIVVGYPQAYPQSNKLVDKFLQKLREDKQMNSRSIRWQSMFPTPKTDRTMEAIGCFPDEADRLRDKAKEFEAKKLHEIAKDVLSLRESCLEEAQKIAFK